MSKRKAIKLNVVFINSYLPFHQAFGVTMWELFSYGFQPWAALTGHQILEAIDEPGGQRLEQPVHCPREHYSIMEACWRHSPVDRPSFAQVGFRVVYSTMMSDCNFRS